MFVSFEMTGKVVLKLIISNQIIDEFVPVLRDWKLIFDSCPVALDYIRT